MQRLVHICKIVEFTVHPDTAKCFDYSEPGAPIVVLLDGAVLRFIEAESCRESACQCLINSAHVAMVESLPGLMAVSAVFTDRLSGRGRGARCIGSL